MTRVYAALNTPRSMLDAIAYAQSVANAMRGNPALPSPTPSLATFTADIAALAAAQVATRTRAAGTASERDARFARVQDDLASLRTYVQHVADATPGNEAVVITSAGMSVKGATAHGKPDFAVKQGYGSGTARLVARAPRVRASYDWQRSVDGVTWVDLERTARADTHVEGLVAGTRYFFRFRTLTRDGLSDWSPVVSLLAL